MYLVGAPLLVIPFAIYNIIAFLMPGVSWSAPLTHLQLMSGADWTMSVGDILVTFTVLILIVEVIKFARIGTRSFVDHALALLLLFGMAAEFVWVSQAATATFFLMLVIAFVEAAGGIGVSLRTRARRRELVIEPEAAPAVPAIEPRLEPKLEPAPSATHPA
ncbi:MAG TPA: hypothetical protein VFC32_05450 [Pseudolabrys sp.]|nr:hypothetical protein [Pseudolabrys sp.]